MSYYDTSIGQYDPNYDPSMAGGGGLPPGMSPDYGGGTMEIAPSYPIASPPTPSAMPGPSGAFPTPFGMPPSVDSSAAGAGMAPAGLSSFDPSLMKSLLGPGGGLGSFLMGGAGGTPDLSSLLSGGTGDFPLPMGTIGDLFGSSIASLIGGGGPNFSTGSAQTGGGIGGMIGGLAGTALGPLGMLGGSAIGDLLGSLIAGYIGGGLPKFAKPQGFANALEGSGNPLEAALGRYIQQYGINRGIDLSSPNPSFQPTALANVLEFLSGTQMPDLHGTTLTPSGQTGYQHPVGLAVQPLQALRALLPNSTNLSLAQIQQLLPEITNLIERRWGGAGRTLKGLLGQENALAEKLQRAETY